VEKGLFEGEKWPERPLFLRFSPKIGPDFRFVIRSDSLNPIAIGLPSNKPDFTSMKAPLSIPNLQQSHPFRQWLEWKIPGTDYTIEGYSRAGDKTFFYLPQLKICLDAGLAEGRQGDFVFLSHCHNDHIADIEYLTLPEGAKLIAPKEITSLLDDYIDARRKLVRSGNYDPALHVNHQTIGLSPEETVKIDLPKRSLLVKTIECDHRTPCLGYAFSELKLRLIPKLEQKKLEMLANGAQAEFGKMMAEMRKSGQTIEEEYAHPLFVFMGDTHHAIFADQDWLWEYPIILTECTYFEEEHLDKADARKHSHWDHLRPHVEAHPDTTFVFTHFSLRYTDAEVITFFEAEREKYGFENVRLWASADPMMRLQGQSAD
jgi:ribonuclease Z